MVNINMMISNNVVGVRNCVIFIIVFVILFVIWFDFFEGRGEK